MNALKSARKHLIDTGVAAVVDVAVLKQPWERPEGAPPPQRQPSIASATEPERESGCNIM
jgi:hypothetical protein